jgi:hypothetical protein
MKPYVYKAITAVSNVAPIRLTAPSHGLVDNWPVWVQGAGGLVAKAGYTVLKPVNARIDPPPASEFHTATVVDANTIELNDINGQILTAYTSGGYVQYLTPVDLSAYSARMTIRTRVGGTSLWTGTSGDGDIVVDNSTKTIALTISDTDTAAFDFLKAIYDLEMYTGSTVSLLASGNVTVAREVAT